MKNLSLKYVNGVHFSLLIFAALLLTSCGGVASNDNEQKLAVATAMVEAWNTKDWETVYELFSEDGVLHSMMIEPIVGRDNIRGRLSVLAAGIDDIELQIGNMGVVNDVVVMERVDDFTYNGNPGRVPVVGIMEIEGDQVTVWREYYDHASLRHAMNPLEDVPGEAPPAVIDTLMALTAKLSTDWNSGDMDGYLNAYWDSAHTSLMFGNKAVRGRQTVVDMYSGNWETEEAMGDFETIDVGIRQLDSKTAIVSGSFMHRFPDETIDGAFTHVWKKFEDGRWLIVHEHTSRAQE